MSATKIDVRRWLGRLLPPGGLLRPAVALGGATLVSQLVGILLSPVYSRLYTPADFGLFSVYNGIVSASLTIGSLCYETGIPIGNDDREAVGLTVIAILLVALTGFGIAAWLGLGALMGWGGLNHQMGGYLWLVPIGIVGAGIYRTIRYWALRCKAMGAIARTSISQVVAANAINLGFGILHPSPLGLILAGIAGISAGMTDLARRTQLIPRMREECGRGLTSGQLWVQAKKYRQLPLISAPSTLFNSLGLYLPAILLAPYFGSDFAGQFFMAMKVVGLPVGLIGGALSQVFFSNAAVVARERPHELSRFFHRVFIRGAACSLLILPVGLVAIWLIPFALGEKWRPAGEIALWLSFYSAVGLSISALSSISNVVGRLKGQLVLDLARALAVFLLLFLGHRAGISGMAVVKGYTLAMIVYYLALYCLYDHLVKQFERTGLSGWNEAAAAP